ncbi:MAG TPA: TonB-dependent receptor [Thermoanaerobaculia bacterium]|nr:TonB-dependent receptor [Thermoanaerobaculia bacterium]
MPTSRALPAAVLAVLAVLETAGTARAQTSCDDAFRQARKSYDLGLFEDVPAQLAPCLGAKVPRATAVQVHTLLALAALATDDPAKARREVSTILRLDTAFEPGPPPRFAALVAEVRKEEQTAQVASVSKTKESLREAPATVAVITGEEIERRGYHDLEEVFHDLPGFDISRSNGGIYSTFYERGFRSDTSDRILLLLDGIEQNDLSGNILFLSRQYPLSNVDRIEVVYGPASTMYGANAYTGVISVLTRTPEDLVPEGAPLGARGQLTSGPFATGAADVTLAGRSQSSSVAWSLTARRFRSGEPDLSSYPDWNFAFETVDYKAVMRLEGPSAQAFCAPVPALCQPGASAYFQVQTDASGAPVRIELTPEGESLARDLDRRTAQSHGFRFLDPTDDWMVYGKLRISNLTLGVELWRIREGNGAEASTPSVIPMSVWIPQETALYVKYSRDLSAGLTFNVLTRYLETGLHRGDSKYLFFESYSGGLLTLADLVQSPPTQPWVLVGSYGQSSSQLKTELGLVYESPEKLTAVGGLDVRLGSLQAQADVVSYDLDDPGNPDRQPLGPLHAEQVQHTDLGAYAQISYPLKSHLKVIAGGRLDYNEITNRRDPGYGFGTLFTPRLAAVYTLGRVVLKAIYSEAFKDPSDFEKLGTVPFVQNYVSNGLRPERVRNYELSANWQSTENAAFEVSLYQASYRDIVALGVKDGCTPSLADLCGQLANLDRFRVRGVQATARLRPLPAFEAFGNFTYTDPVETAPQPGLAVGDVAPYRFNLGLTARPLRKLTFDLRGSYVAVRRTGPGTTVATNPVSSVPSSFDLKLALTWSLASTLTLQLTGGNLLDRAIFDPGVESPGFGFAAVLPQPGRTLYLRLLTDL